MTTRCAKDREFFVTLRGASGRTEQTKHRNSPACRQPLCELILTRCPHVSGFLCYFHQSRTSHAPQKTRAIQCRSNTFSQNYGRHPQATAAETIINTQVAFLPQPIFLPSRSDSLPPLPHPRASYVTINSAGILPTAPSLLKP